ncbi:aspartyl/asparaginyl beta-hydroxylase isoform X2 [Denticeps clupeoides]|uniref:aspartyl/asparaginyl beta-hydroxylase isoform X2 n=1 Tax=Denticeps clupeoides TaxID=299321 RepID=UPI0010A47C0E|nr:aspartyl/asparaginyl beta-hydroxylase isoform X2 [Denticeps clupeoides]
MAENSADGSNMVPETEPAPVPVSKNGKKTEGSSIFTWFFVLALLGVWTSVGFVWFDLVDYDSVVDTLAIYDVDGDGHFGVEDAKVLLGLKEKLVAVETREGSPVHEPVVQKNSEDQRGVRPDVAQARQEVLEDDFVPFDQSGSNSESFSQDENLEGLDATGELVVESPEEESDEDNSDTVMYSERSSSVQTAEAAQSPAESTPDPPRDSIPTSIQESGPESSPVPEPIPASVPEGSSEPSTAAESVPESKPDSTAEPVAKKKKPKLLNKFDKTIKSDIDAAEKLRKKGKVEEALRAFESLVQKYPHSPRSRYGKAQSEDDLAEKLRSNEMLLKAVNTYREAAELPEAPEALVKDALKRRAERQQFLGRMRGALGTLQLLVQTFPDDVSLQNDLGVAYLLVGDNSGAKKVYEEVLAKVPGDGFAKVHYGFILKSENKIAESIPFLREGLESGAPGTDDGRFYFHLGDALQRVGDQSAYHWYDLGHKHGHFASVWQRSLYNVKGLKAQPWWTPKETGYGDLVKTLERNWLTIRDEALSVMNTTSGLFVPEDENLRETGSWGQFTLWQQGRKSASSCQSVPKTCALMERYPEAIGCKRGQIKFSVMQPGTHVWPHTGPTNCRLRMHLGLVVPKGCKIRCTTDTREWEEGKVLIFDDSFEHEVWQEADTYRLIFIVDVWHPELSHSQRQSLSPI